MDDLISRQQVIDALDVLCQEHRYKIPGKVETYSQYNEAWQDALDRAEGAIGNLPSAQPEKRTEERTETHGVCSDTISRQSVLNALAEIEREVEDGDGFQYEKWKDHFCDLPSARSDRSLWFRIGEICVDESKGFISKGRAFEKIRELLREAERRTDETD